MSNCVQNKLYWLKKAIKEKSLNKKLDVATVLTKYSFIYMSGSPKIQLTAILKTNLLINIY